jgi:hypothetical protein
LGIAFGVSLLSAGLQTLASGFAAENRHLWHRMQRQNRSQLTLQFRVRNAHWRSRTRNSRAGRLMHFGPLLGRMKPCTFTPPASATHTVIRTATPTRMTLAR